MKRFFSRDIVLVPFLLILSSLPRLFLLARMECGIESDEAIVGLMGKHIAEGRTWPIFYYGQDYMGSFEPSLVAGIFSLFGVSNCALKSVPFIFSLLFVISIYLLAKRVTSRGGAFVAGILAALGPSTLILWSVKARGGFIELMVFGTLAMLIACDLMQRDSKRESLRVFFLGIILGLAWWINNQAIFYISSIGLILLLFWLRKERIGSLLNKITVGSLGFFIGGAPFWYANFFLEPRFATFKTLLFNEDGTPSRGFLEHLKGFFEVASPIILGARRFWSSEDVFSFASVIIGLVYVVSILVVFQLRLGRKGEERRTGSKNSLDLLILFLFLVPFVFCASKFGWLSAAPRYLLPMYSVLFVLVGIACSYLWSFSSFLGKTFSSLIFVIILGTNLASNYWGKIAVPGEPFVELGERVSRDHKDLYKFLLENNYRHIFTDYWIGYRVAFETKERVLFSRYRGPQVKRIPEYDLEPIETEEKVFVLVPSQADALSRRLSQMGFDFRKTKLSGYVVFDLLYRELPKGYLDTDRMQVAASHNSEDLISIFDDDSGTRWGTGLPMAPDMHVQVNFTGREEIEGVLLDQGFLPHDAPRALTIEGREKSGDWCTLFDSAYTNLFEDVRNGAFSEHPRVIEIVFEKRELTALRLSQHGQHPIFDWSIAELELLKAKRED